MRKLIRIILTALYAVTAGPLVGLGLGVVEGLEGWITSTLTIWNRLK